MATIVHEVPRCLHASSAMPSWYLRQEALINHASLPPRPAGLRLRQPCAYSMPISMASGRRSLSTTTACQARLIPRPQRPYQFTQLVQLSDGSTFTVRTTNPNPLHRCTKDSRNHVLWQPSEKSLRNVEVDEAGKLAAFRSRFGRGWDAASKEADRDGNNATQPEQVAESTATVPSKPASEHAFDTLADLLSGYAAKEEPLKRGGLSAKDQARKDKKKK